MSNSLGVVQRCASSAAHYITSIVIIISTSPRHQHARCCTIAPRQKQKILNLLASVSASGKQEDHVIICILIVIHTFTPIIISIIGSARDGAVRRRLLRCCGELQAMLDPTPSNHIG